MSALRTCIITGASRGIGLATALRFAKLGCQLVIAARNAPDLDAAAKQIQSYDAPCEALPVDVSTSTGGQELIDVAMRRFGRIDILVNNAGAAPCASFDEFTPEQFQCAVGTNIGGVYHVTRAAWPIMRDQKTGTIVNVSSVAALDPFPSLTVYAACKAWVNTFTQALAAEGKAMGIRVFAVGPGAVETQMLRSVAPGFPADQTLAPHDVAEMIESICGEPWRYSSGQTIYIRK